MKGKLRRRSGAGGAVSRCRFLTSGRSKRLFLTQPVENEVVFVNSSRQIQAIHRDVLHAFLKR